VSGAARVAALVGLLATALGQAACATCRPGSPVSMRPSVGGSVSRSGASTWGSPGVGLDVSQLFCRAPDAAIQPQPGPGSPPIPDLSRTPATKEKAPDSTPL